MLMMLCVFRSLVLFAKDWVCVCVFVWMCVWIWILYIVLWRVVLLLFFLDFLSRLPAVVLLLLSLRHYSRRSVCVINCCFFFTSSYCRWLVLLFRRCRRKMCVKITHKPNYIDREKLWFKIKWSKLNKLNMQWIRVCFIVIRIHTYNTNTHRHNTHTHRHTLARV